VADSVTPTQGSGALGDPSLSAYTQQPSVAATPIVEHENTPQSTQATRTSGSKTPVPASYQSADSSGHHNSTGEQQDDVSREVEIQSGPLVQGERMKIKATHGEREKLSPGKL
jgi:hypothetical protein